jgi:hypothetical protein
MFTNDYLVGQIGNQVTRERVRKAKQAQKARLAKQMIGRRARRTK